MSRAHGARETIVSATVSSSSRGVTLRRAERKDAKRDRVCEGATTVLGEKSGGSRQAVDECLSCGRVRLPWICCQYCIRPLRVREPKELGIR